MEIAITMASLILQGLNLAINIVFIGLMARACLGR